MAATDLQRVWIGECLRLVAWLAVCAVVGLIAGYLESALVIGLASYLALHLWYAFQLHRWLTTDHIEPADGVGIWRDIYTQLHRLKRRNRRRKKRLKHIVNEFQASTAALPDGAVVLDRLGRINWFNAAAAAALGLHPVEDRGQRIINLIRHPRFASFVASSEDDQAALEIPSPINERDTLLIRIVPYGNDQRLLIARDISSQKRQEATRRDFAANASHELRTPLTVLRGYLDMMADDSGDDGALNNWRQPLADMQAQSQRMGRIIDSLLLLARVEGQSLSQEQASIDVPAMLDEQVDNLRHGLGADHEFVFDIDRSLALYGRAGELGSVLSNLLTNAARYTSGNGRIEVIWRQDEQGAYFAVRDNGPGIAAAHIPRLTERFYRADPGRQSGDGGTGLGLAIVKHCLEHHESELQIDSQPARGSTFSCRFPPQRVLARRTA